MTNFGDMEPNDPRNQPTKRVSYDPRISLNTMVMCLTAIGVSWGLIDKLTTNAAATATIQAETRMNSAAILQINQQRSLDRQELLIEIRSLRADVSSNVPRTPAQYKQ